VFDGPAWTLDPAARLFEATPWLANARIGDDPMSRTLLDAVTDGPGHYHT